MRLERAFRCAALLALIVVSSEDLSSPFLIFGSSPRSYTGRPSTAFPTRILWTTNRWSWLSSHHQADTLSNFWRPSEPTDFGQTFLGLWIKRSLPFAGTRLRTELPPTPPHDALTPRTPSAFVASESVERMSYKRAIAFRADESKGLRSSERTGVWNSFSLACHDASVSV